jgi:hypothetical protein
MGVVCVGMYIYVSSEHIMTGCSSMVLALHVPVATKRTSSDGKLQYVPGKLCSADANQPKYPSEKLHKPATCKTAPCTQSSMSSHVHACAQFGWTSTTESKLDELVSPITCQI